MADAGRRKCLAVLGGALAWPLAAHGQQSNSVRRIGLLSPGSEDDHELHAVYAAFPRELQKLGWASGRNLQIDQRWGGGDDNRLRTYAQELVTKSPDAILVISTQATAILKQV